MLEVKIDASDAVPLITLKGRLDSYGASEFDRQVSSVQEDTRYLICDLSEVDYLSSSGVRSLIKLEKGLITKGGRLTR